MPTSIGNRNSNLRNEIYKNLTHCTLPGPSCLKYRIYICNVTDFSAPDDG